MTTFLAYTSPAAGHVFPLVPGLLELQRRGHRVHLRTAPDLVDTLRAVGLDAAPVSPDVVRIEPTDYRAETDAARLHSGQVDLIERGRFDGPDLAAAIAETEPDVLLVDSIAYGALSTAQASGLPTALLLPSVLPWPGRGIPPYGLGLKPGRGPLTRVRDGLLWKVVERMFGKAMLPGLNELRAGLGLAPFRSPLDQWSAVDAVIVMTSEPLEYPRTDLPAHFTFVGAQPWDPPSDRPAWLDEPGDPWVLVTCSTDYQGDEDLARVAVEALRDEPVRVLLTLADAYDGAGLTSGGNVRVERFVPHGHVLPECAAVVCHGGFGIVSKAMASGVPSVVVPFGRDQPEIARRVTEAGAGVSLKPKQLSADALRAAVVEARALAPGAQRAAAVLRENGGAGRFAAAALSVAGSQVAGCKP
ncbi:MAG TPA: glycosyltransferase [Nocardioides sp.]|uniref:glycosyltransferase n=1 Tax=Nocardioides sp. TaxID=35761 RepID=UPI002E308DF4|nr:glycosyltransferase [Nocardioides sp.]HEX5091004.1 glycosyltransferase [Nocardioides sp.]